MIERTGGLWSPVLSPLWFPGLAHMRLLIGMVRDQGGASAAEYALILGIVGAAIAIAALTLGATISDSMNVTSGRVANCAGLC